jgi:hypothetical protein
MNGSAVISCANCTGCQWSFSGQTTRIQPSTREKSHFLQRHADFADSGLR